ncbi:MAG: hypothetical protein OXM55_03055 [Bdellovibrionales bacterium]|nr:hypothetical protein [Bdellovibrionales bacterium]
MFKWFRKGFNSYTLQAMKLKTDEELKEHCLKCIDKIAKDNKKDIKSVSLEDIYRVLYKIRKKTPKLLREIKLSQIEKTIKSFETVGDISSLIYSIAYSTPIPVLLIPIKKIFGKRIKYVIVIWIASVVAMEIYGSKKKH